VTALDVDSMLCNGSIIAQDGHIHGAEHVPVTPDVPLPHAWPPLERFRPRD
jgi:hypothetical protein